MMSAVHPAVPAAGTVADLAIVIPVWNLPEDLVSLLSQIEALGIFAEVVIADDASDLPCDPASLGFTAKRLGVRRLAYLRADQRGGAGHARNIGLQAVTARNVIFFDADDRIGSDLPQIWQAHCAEDSSGMPLDFTIFRHADSRVLAAGRNASFPTDERRWLRALRGTISRRLDAAGAAALCTISAYPWNKIYRTAFLRDHGILCSETPVHNDIKLHWLSFAHASDILALTGIGAIHEVGVRAHHLTTRRGAERLCIFDILADVLAGLRQAHCDPLILRGFVQFTHDICQWDLGQVEARLLPAFAAGARRAYLAFRPEEFALYALWQPDRADEMARFAIGARDPAAGDGKVGSAP
jgi:hypothetical protein